MNSKKKVIVAICAFAMVILAAIIAIVAVLAAQQVSVQSQVNITYTASANVIGSVSASYKMEDGTTNDLTSASFDGDEEENKNKDLGSVGDLNFTKDNTYIEFTFKFKNDSEISKYTATLSFTNGFDGNGTITNMKLEGRLSSTQNSSSISTDDLNNLVNIEVPVQQTVTYILKVSIDSTAKDAAFTGTMLWNLVATRVS